MELEMKGVVEGTFPVPTKNEAGNKKDVNLGEDKKGVENNREEEQIQDELGPMDFKSYDQG